MHMKTQLTINDQHPQAKMQRCKRVRVVRELAKH